MSVNDKPDRADLAGDVTTVIGHDAVFHGDIETGLGVRVEGLLEGSIRTTSHIVVAGSGEAQGKIEGGIVEVHGHIDGEINARKRVRFGTSCRVSGRVVAGAVRIDDGADLQIHIQAGNGRATRPDEKPEAELPGRD